MARLSFNVPDDIKDKIRRAAKSRGLSISSYLAELVRERLGAGSQWPPGFFEQTLGGWQGDFPKIEDLPLQERGWPE